MRKIEITKQLTEEEANKLYRAYFLMNSQEVILRVVAEAQPLNQELYDKEKGEYEKRKLDFQMLNEGIMHKYFSKEMQGHDVVNWGFYLDVFDKNYTLRGLESETWADAKREDTKVSVGQEQ